MKPGHGRFMLLTIVLLGMGSLLLLLRFHTATGQEGVDRAKEIFLPLVRKQRELSFSGRTWIVKTSDGPVGPGPNYFSDDVRDVFVDGQGLHLKIVPRDGRWYATEVISQEALGYGTYSFEVASNLAFDPNVVLGLFTWDDAAPQYNYREIDIEFSKFGDPGGTNASYTIQPWQTPANMHRFDVTPPLGTSSMHAFTWQPAAVHFRSTSGGTTLQEWTYTGADIPPAGSPSTLHARMNLWLLNPPTDGQPVEVVIRSFTFEPYQPPPPCMPTIEFTSVPPIGSSNNLYGRVACVEPANYLVAVYIQVNGGWWTKPYWSAPLTRIHATSNWVCDITTGGEDIKATKIAAFLLPNGVTPPQRGGETYLPAELFAYPYVQVNR